MNYKFYTFTDAGLRTGSNQDAYALQAALTSAGPLLMAVVCDGVGGLSKGEVASASVVTAFADWFREDLPEIVNCGGILIELVKQSWEKLTEKINQSIFNYTRQSGKRSGTTVSALFTCPGKALMLQIGDSRIYQYRGCNVVYITKDQTLAQKEFDAGNITEEQLKIDKRSHVLLQCLGATGMVNPVFTSTDVGESDTFVICSDGFYRHLSNDDISLLTKKDTNNDKVLGMLSNLAKSRKETDNITAVVVNID